MCPYRRPSMITNCSPAPLVAERAVAERQPRQRMIGDLRRSQSRRASRRRRQQAALAGAEQRLDRRRASRRSRREQVERVALADGAEIQLEIGRAELHRAVLAARAALCSSRRPPSAVSSSVVDGKPAFAPQEAPTPAERSRGDVERAIGRRRQSLRSRAGARINSGSHGTGRVGWRADSGTRCGWCRGTR